MRGLDLDYQRKPNNITLLGIVVCVLAVGVLTLMVFKYMQVREDSQIVEIELRQIESKTHSQTGDAGKMRDARTLAREVKQANQVLKMLGLRWDSIFGAVAAAHRDGVALLALAPEPDKRIVKISAEAKNFSVMLDYVKRLEEQPALGEVYLQSHNLQKRDPQRPVRFVVLADWLDK